MRNRVPSSSGSGAHYWNAAFGGTTLVSKLFADEQNFASDLFELGQYHPAY
jgi:hypothetical protein